MDERIVIIGAGAIGGGIGSYMVRAGEGATFVDDWAEHVQAVRGEGMHITCLEPNNSFDVPVRALHVSDVPQLIREQSFDIAFIRVKSCDREWPSHLIFPYMASDDVFVSLQNSIIEEWVAAIASWGRTTACAVGAIGGELAAPGRVSRTTLLGSRQHGAVRNGVSASAGLSGNQRDSIEATRWSTIQLGSQALRVGQAMGLSLENTGHDLGVLTRAGEDDRWARKQPSAQLLEIVGTRDNSQRPSMGQDIVKGRRTETEFINGLAAHRGGQVGVDATPHACVNELVKQVERGMAKPSLDLVAGL